MAIRKLFITSAIFFLWCSTLTLKGQFIDHKLNLYLGFHAGIGNTADKFINEDGFIMPTFLGHINSWNGIQAKAIYHMNRNLSAGLQTGNTLPNPWNSETHSIYHGATLSVRHFGLTLRLETPQLASGIYNKLKFYGEAGPAIAINTLYLEKPFVTPTPTGGLYPLKNRSTGWGFLVSTGAELVLHQFAGVFMALHYDYFSISTIYIPDKSLSRFRYEFGVYTRLFPNRKYFYR